MKWRSCWIFQGLLGSLFLLNLCFGQGPTTPNPTPIQSSSTDEPLPIPQSQRQGYGQDFPRFVDSSNSRKKQLLQTEIPSNYVIDSSNNSNNNNIQRNGGNGKNIPSFSTTSSSTSSTSRRNNNDINFQYGASSNHNISEPLTPQPVSYGPEFGPRRQTSGAHNEPRYFIVGSKWVRPGQTYRIIVDIFETQSQDQIDVKASLLRNGVEIGSDIKTCSPKIQEMLMIEVPKTSVPGQYRLRVEGNDAGLVGGTAFLNETDLRFSLRSMTIFIQTDKPIYMQSQTVRFRAIPITAKLKAFGDPMDVYMIDPKGNVVRRWLSRQSGFGAISLNYTISDQPVFGKWTLRVQALNQIEEKSFVVEEYYQPRFEVNVTMPAYLFDTDETLYGSVTGKFTSGAPVHGNLTLVATVKQIDGVKRATRSKEVAQQYVSSFQGFHEFKIPLWEIESGFGQLAGLEVTVTGKIGSSFWHEINHGYSRAQIISSNPKLEFLGGSPQIFKPGMPFTSFVTISHQDGSALRPSRLWNSELEIQAEVEIHNSRNRRLDPRFIKMLPDHPGIWKIVLNLRDELSLGSDRLRQTSFLISQIQSLRIQANFRNKHGETGTAKLTVIPQYSPRNKHLRVSTSTSNPSVGQLIVFHLRTNFYADRFTFLILSKSGEILTSGFEAMDHSTIRTFAIPVSPQMVPASTILVYHVAKSGDGIVVVDSLTFPVVDGFPKNNFTITVRSTKEKPNNNQNLAEVIVRGEPGSWVGMSGIDAGFYTMQAGNEITYAGILDQLSQWDKSSLTHGPLTHRWFSRDGLVPDELVYFPTHSNEIDANRTFDYSGLVVFTDIELPFKEGGRMNEQEFKHESSRFNLAKQQIEFRTSRANRLQNLFENTWLWKDVIIGPEGSYKFKVPVPDKPALWMISGIGMGTNNGFGLLRSSLRYSGVRQISINVEMPSKSRQGEEIGIRLTVFNYMKKKVEVMLVLGRSPDYNFVYRDSHPHSKPKHMESEHQHLIWIAGKSSTQLHFPIIPTRLGEITIRILAVSQNSREEVTRKLRVDPDGIPQSRHLSVLLDLSNRAYVVQFVHTNLTESFSNPRSRFYLPSSNMAEVSVTGDVVGPAFPTMPMNTTNLLGGKPMDSAEQNMFSFAANLYTLMYMKLTNQNQGDRSTVRSAFNHLNLLYQQQLRFQNLDGSFSLFRSDWNNSKPSVWVTAYCARVLAEASFSNQWENFLYIDPTVVSRAVDWVIGHQSRADGSFYESDPSGTIYTNSRINHNTLTAHVLISLHAIKDIYLPSTSPIGQKLALAREGGLHYLESKLDQMIQHRERDRESIKPYETSLIAYALLLYKSTKAESAFILLSGLGHFEAGYAYWSRESQNQALTLPLPSFMVQNNKPYLLPQLQSSYNSENIETTAYALMVYTARQEEIHLEAIVKWLNAQRQTDGGWASTQDTAAAYRALIDYTIQNSNRQKNIRNVTKTTELTVTVELPESMPGIARTFHVNSYNLAQRQSIYIPNAHGTISVEAKGTGYAILQMHLQYSVNRQRFITDPPISAFELYPRIQPGGRNASLIEYRSCQSWILQSESERSGMAVLEVNIPTGYYVHQPKLDTYVRSNLVPRLKSAKFQDDKVVLYFDYLERQPTCVSFTAQRLYPVANMTRYLSVRVYDYYTPERFNETIVDGWTWHGLDICQVCGSYQCAHCPTFPGSTAGPILSNPVISVILVLVLSLVILV